MTLSDLLREMQRNGLMGSKQKAQLEALHAGRILSVRQELQIGLYLGVLLIGAGIAWTIRDYFARLGHIAIIGSLSLGALAAFAYCLFKAPPYSRREAPSPTIFFDYALLFGCILYSIDIAYIETNFHPLGDLWTNYLLVSAIFFFALAYRFDNRMVLSLALSTLAAWLGFRLSAVSILFREYARFYAMAFGLLSALIGVLGKRLTVKKHFLDIYLNYAVHFILPALISGLFIHDLQLIYLLGALAACGILAAYAFIHRRFLYMLYAVVYGYIALSIVIVDVFKPGEIVLSLYLTGSSVGVIFLMLALSRKLKEDE